MEVIRHLSDEELAEPIVEPDQEALRQTLESLPECARTATERNDEFWRNQRIAIWSRISSAENRPERRLGILAWALATATIAVSGWLLDRAFVTPLPEARVDPDHELLIEVERVVQIDGPAALEPAALLAEEMVQDLTVSDSPIRKKEPSHEN